MIETAQGIEDLLRQCGVTESTLAPREKDALDRLGYLVLPNVIDDGWLARLRAAFSAAVSQGGRHGAHVQLDWQEEVFDGIYTHPKVLAAVHHVLGRSFRTFPPVARDPLPGFGQQGLHPDWGRTPAGPFHVVTVLWMLDDFTPHNGATRVIPGSHRWLKPLPKPAQSPERRHPDQTVIQGEAGSALLFNGHLWHGGTRNESTGSRRALQCQFRARDVVLPTDPPLDLPARLTAPARYLLGGEGDLP